MKNYIVHKSIYDLKTDKNYLEIIHFYIIGLFILTLPYHIHNSVIGGFSITIFILGLLTYKRDLKELFTIKHIQFLFLFFTIVLLSYFYSEENNFSLTIQPFKYFPLIIVGIYLSALTKKQIEVLFLLFAISPIAYVIIYYLNFFHITTLYSSHYDSNGSKILMMDLIANIIIVLSATYFFVLSIKNMNNKHYYKTTIYFILFTIFALSIFIDPKTHSRSMDIALLASIVIVLVYMLKWRTIVLYFIISIVLITMLSRTSHGTYISKEFFKAYNNIEKAIYHKQYNSSSGYRVGMIKLGSELIVKNPILGIGNNSLTHVEHVRSDNIEFKTLIPYLHSFHNEHIFFLVSYGILGYFMIVLFGIYYYKYKIKNSYLFIFKNVIIISYVWVMTIGDYLSNKTNGNMFALLLALLTLYAILEKENDEN